MLRLALSDFGKSTFPVVVLVYPTAENTISATSELADAPDGRGQGRMMVLTFFI